MFTNTLKASALIAAAAAFVVTLVPANASAKGGHGGGGIQAGRPHLAAFHVPKGWTGLRFPVHGPNSSHNPRPPVIGQPFRSEPMRGYGWRKGFRGHGMGGGLGVVYLGGSACPTYFHRAPRFARCIANYT